VNLAPKDAGIPYVMGKIPNFGERINPSRRDARTLSLLGDEMGAFSERGDHVIPVSGKGSIFACGTCVHAF
jgi:hypothetical protein